MLTLKSVTMKNFMSTGAVTQSVDLTKSGITLVFGENLDLGSNGSRNGVGKCLCINTMVKIRNTKTGEISEISIGDLYHAQKEKSRRKC